MMAKKTVFLTLVVLIAGSVFWLTVKALSAASAGPAIQAQDSCIQPTGKAIQACREMEQHILAATVRIELAGWIVAGNESSYQIENAVGHATIKGGRYLVTHNHFGIPLSIRPRDGEQEVYTVVTLTNNRGEKLFEGPLSDFELAWEDAQTLVFAYKDGALFDKLGLVSAEFVDWSSVPLEVGTEVAQIDWDGATTRVDWAKVKEINVNEGVPRVLLDDDVTLGASGGGIFWQGVHVANNWMQVQQYDEDSGALVDIITKGALNSIRITGDPGQEIPSI
jgi:hypothetical protein